MAIIAKKTVVFSNKKLDTKEPPSRQKEIKTQKKIEPEVQVTENHKSSNEKGILVHKPSQFMHDMLNDQYKQE